jgi:hypothetical protein
MEVLGAQKRYKVFILKETLESRYDKQESMLRHPEFLYQKLLSIRFLPINTNQSLR